MEYSKQDFLETASPQTLKQIAKTRELTRKYNQIEHSDTEARTALLRELFGAIGENVEIDTPFYCDHGKNIFIGNDVIININCTFVDNRPIYIGNQVLIASNVQIYTSSHPVLPQERFVADWKRKGTTFFRTFAKPVTCACAGARFSRRYDACRLLPPRRFPALRTGRQSCPDRCRRWSPAILRPP